jgi:5-methylthioadenosine/S-adenosylhomocysteine deaminase
MLRNGVTTTSEMYFFPDALATGAIDSGIRVVVAAAILDAPGLDRFGTPDQMIGDALRLRAAYAGHELVEVALGPHSAYTLSADTLREVADAAAAEEMLVHIHVLETRTELEEAAARGQAAVPAYLADLGLFAGRAIAAHGVWLGDADIDLLAGLGVGVAHCPGSNGKIASGIAPVAAMRKAGVAVGVATDGPASNDNLDLLEEARLALLYARLREQDSQALEVGDALRMMTSDAARALGRDDIGSLTPGRRADFLRVDVSGLPYEPVLADTSVLDNFVWSGSSRDVTDVWVGGTQVVAAGVCTTVDSAELGLQLREVAKRISA